MRAFAVLAITSLVLSAGCGAPQPDRGTADSGAVADSGPADAGPVDAGVYPATFPTPPQVVTSNGPVLANPEFIPVFFTGDDATIVSSATDFLAKVGTTAYWTRATMEYGVGAATSKPAITVDASEVNALISNGTLADSAIQTWLKGKLEGTDGADAGSADAGVEAVFPPAGPNSIYVLFFPANVTVEISNGGFGGTSTSCNQFGGYHSDINLDSAFQGINVSYAVIPRCASFDGLSGADAVTAATSHEIAEASTDPYPSTNPAYSQVDAQHLYWGLIQGGEVGDMCAQNPQAFTTYPDLNYVAQRIWSNKEALAGNDPCVPWLPNEVFFNAAPELPDMVPFPGGLGGSFVGVTIPIGSSKTIPIDLWSDAATDGPWEVQVRDISSEIGGELQLSLTPSSGVNGDQLQLTITNVKASQYGINLFLVTSQSGNEENYWFGAVGD